MLIGGEDRGQARLGLKPNVAENRNVFAVTQVIAPVTELQKPDPQADGLQIVSASFAPKKPLMVMPASSEVALTQPEASEVDVAELIM